MTDPPDEVDEPFDAFQEQVWSLPEEEPAAGEEGDDQVLVSSEFDGAFLNLVNRTVGGFAVDRVDLGTATDASQAIVEQIGEVSGCMRSGDRAEAVERLVDLSRSCLMLTLEHEPDPAPPETMDRSTGLANLGMLAYHHARSDLQDVLPLARSGSLRWMSALCGRAGKVAYAAHLISFLIEGEDWAADELTPLRAEPDETGPSDPLLLALAAYGFTCFELAATALYIATAIVTEHKGSENDDG